MPVYELRAKLTGGLDRLKSLHVDDLKTVRSPHDITSVHVSCEELALDPGGRRSRRSHPALRSEAPAEALLLPTESTSAPERLGL